MSFSSRVLGLNRLSPHDGAYSPPAVTDDDLARSLALWTNADFSYDDGGVGLDSAQKLLDADAAAAVAAQAALGLSHGQQLQHQDDASTADFFAGLAGDGTDAFNFNAGLFTFPDEAAFAPLLAPTAASPSIDLTPSHTPAAASVAGPKGRKASATAGARSGPAAAAADVDVKEESSPASTEPITAEDDKRRRNTAASARFRQKKKEREKALESSAKELQNRCATLEKEVESLRRENSWLKGLVVGGAPAFVDAGAEGEAAEPADKKRRVE